MSHEPRAELLIVDDEIAHMQALCNTLSDHHFIAAGVASPAEALKALRHKRFDLLLTDLTMPEMDGIALLRAALEIDPNLVGIMMTGHGTIDTAVEAMKVGALDYILKPFKLSAILPVLSRAMSVRRLRLENEDLQKRVKARTAELEAANRELDAFAGSVAHDLRAPIRHIEGYAQFLKEECGTNLGDDGRSYVGNIIGSAKRLGDLIARLLEFSRLSRAGMTIEDANLNEITAAARNSLQLETAGREINWKIGPLPVVRGDPTLLLQVMYNLIANAIKYTRNQPVAQIEIGAKAGEAGGHVIFVRDNGAGFDMKYAEKLFGVFQRLHSNEQFEGTGVGLANVRRIVLRHGGKTWAEGEVDQGATFYFSLPVNPV